MDTVMAIGGEGPQQVVIGGRVNYRNADMHDKWDAHKRLGKSDFKIKTINEILALPEYIGDAKLLKEVLVEIWSAPIEKIFNGIIRSLELDEPMIIARRTMFWKLKELIESVILLHMKLVQKLNVKQMVAKWTSNIKKNKIDTSSVILWTLFNKANRPKVKLFVNIHFNYLGYCPHVANDRIKALLQFPGDKLINEIKKASSNPNMFILEFKGLDEMLLGQIGPMPISAELKRCKKPTISDANYTESFMGAWLDLNDSLKPFLEDSEHYYIDIAKKMDAVSGKLDKINKKMLSLIH